MVVTAASENAGVLLGRTDPRGRTVGALLAGATELAVRALAPSGTEDVAVVAATVQLACPGQRRRAGPPPGPYAALPFTEPATARA